MSHFIEFHQNRVLVLPIYRSAFKQRWGSWNLCDIAEEVADLKRFTKIAKVSVEIEKIGFFSFGFKLFNRFGMNIKGKWMREFIVVIHPFIDIERIIVFYRFKDVAKRDTA
jgi:hypothetical protein